MPLNNTENSNAENSTNTNASTAGTSSTAEKSTRAQPRVRRGVLITGAVLALGALLGTGATIQAVSAEQARELVAIERAEELAAERKEAQHKAAVARAAERRLAEEVESAINAANPVLAAADGKVDASALAASVASLTSYEVLDQAEVLTHVSTVESTIPVVQAAVTEAERLEAERAAQAAAAAQQAAEAAAAQKRAAASMPPGSAQALAHDMMAARYGWGGDQANCLNNLWQKESGWRADAMNPSSGATGIPQALPGSKMATHGADWQTNPATQISWGLDYIASVYGTPCAAWNKSQAVGWY